MRLGRPLACSAASRFSDSAADSPTAANDTDQLMAEQELREIVRAQVTAIAPISRSEAEDGAPEGNGSDGRTALASQVEQASGESVASEFTLAFDDVSLDVRHPSLWSNRRPVLAAMTGVFGPFGLHCVVCADPAVSLHCLQVLAGIQRRISAGCVMANGIPCASDIVRSRIGFITSIDGLLLEATVRENLTFCVNMRIVPGSLTTVEDIAERVAAVVELDDALDSLVDGLTNGQRLRLAIAMELVLGPAALMIANPLPLLLQGEMPQFIRILRRIESGNSGDPRPTTLGGGQAVSSGRRCLVLVSSSQLPYIFYDSINSLMLLSATGYVVFQGPRSECVSFLSSVLYSQQPAVARRRDSSGGEAEAAANVRSGELEVLSRGEAIADLVVQWGTENEIGHVVNAFKNSEVRLSALETIRRFRDSVDGLSGRYHMTNVLRRHRAPPILTRMLLLLGYTIRRAVFRVDFIFAWLGLFAAFFLLAALSDKQGADQNGMQNKRGIIFFLLSCVTHVNTIFIEAEVSEYRSFVHLRNNQYFTVPEYFAATIARIAIPRVIFSVIGALFSSFIFRFALPLAVLLGLVSFTHHVLLVLLTFWWPYPRLLIRISLVYYAYSVMFSGFLICLSSVPSFLGDVSVLRRAYGGALAHELRDRPYSCDAQITPNITLVMSYCYTGNQYLEMEGFALDSWERSCAVLAVAMSILLLLVAFSMKVSWVSK